MHMDKPTKPYLAAISAIEVMPHPTVITLLDFIQLAEFHGLYAIVSRRDPDTNEPVVRLMGDRGRLTTFVRDIIDPGTQEPIENYFVAE